MVWTDARIERLREMRAVGEPRYLCAEKIGVAYPTAVFKVREWGIAQRMNRGRMSGPACRRKQPYEMAFLDD
jgi:hypothetical protein